MDADRSRESMTEAVDRELQSLLAVDPSPELVARVRMRIANEPEPAAWWLSWKLAGFAAGAVIVIAVVVVMRSPGTHRTGPSLAATHPAPETSVTAPSVAAAPPSREYVAPAVKRTSSGSAEARRHVMVEAGHPAQPVEATSELLLDARETAALRALIGGVRRGDLDLEPVLRASTPSVMELPPMTEIAIPPITIAPLVDEGVRP